MDRTRSDTSERPASSTCRGQEQNESLLPCKGFPDGDQVEGRSNSFCSSPGDILGSRSDSVRRTDLPGACPTIKMIRKWTDGANISFKYTNKKIEQSVKEANKKMRKRQAKNMGEESGCNYLECTQCKISFPSEAELRKHLHHSDEHHAKVRAKSESKTLGDLKLFAKFSARMRQFILDKVPLPTPKHPSPPVSPTAGTVEVSEQTQASLLPDPPPETTEQTAVGNSFDMDDDMMKEFLDPDPDLDLDLKMDEFDEEKNQRTDAAQLQEEFRNEEGKRNGVVEEKVRANLQEENRKLRERLKQVETENRKKQEENMKLRERLKQVKTEMSQENLQKICLELKKNEKKDVKEGEKKNEMGYEFPNDKFYRVMWVFKQTHDSVWELVVDLLLCFVTVNRGTEYKERLSEGGKSEDGERASKKRKRRGGESGIEG